VSRDKPIRRNDDIRSPIFDEIMDRTPPATHKDNVALARRVQAGDMEAAEEMLHRNLRFAILRAKQCHPPDGIDIQSWYQVAVAALWDAILRYDPSRGKLSSMARPYIITALNLFKLEQLHAVRIPPYNWDAFNSTRSYTLDCRVGNGEETSKSHQTWLELMMDGGELPDAEVENKETGMVAVDAVGYLLDMLNDRERIILVRYFGLDGEPREPLHIVGDRVGVSGERVRQIKEDIFWAARRDQRLMSAYESVK
jgi:DNA-directed RNA polymerase sigma subunit (sigma70/sigma32)